RPVALRGPAGRRQRHRRCRSRARPASAPRRPMSSVVGLALTGFVLLAGVAAVDVGALAGARAAAQTAAEMAALAALAPQDGSAASGPRRRMQAQGPVASASRHGTIAQGSAGAPAGGWGGGGGGRGADAPTARMW